MKTPDLSTVAGRVEWARSKKNWSQAELGRRIDTKAQTVQSIESGRTRKTRYLLAIARETGINADWLETGNGEATAPLNAAQPQPAYEVLTPAALEIAHLFAKLPKHRQRAVKEYLFLEAIVASKMPWLLPNDPNGTSYREFERKVERAYRDALRKSAVKV